MTNKELKGLSRQELLEMLIEQSKKVNALQAGLDQANARLAERQIQVEKAGSIAEAALALNHIFEDAQAAAEQYLENLRIQCAASDARAAAANEKAEACLTDAQEKAEAIVREANDRAELILKDAHAERERILTQTNQECQRRLEEFRERMQQFLETQEAQ